MAEQKKLTPEQEAMNKAWGKEFTGSKSPGVSKAIITSIGLILVTVFFIIPAIIGMVSSGYVNLTDPLSVGFGITIAVFIFIGAVYIPGEGQMSGNESTAVPKTPEDAAKQVGNLIGALNKK